MATVTGLSKDRMIAIEGASVVSGAIDANGHLILTKHDGTTIDAGSALPAIPNASDTVKGLIEIATDAEAAAGTDALKAVVAGNLGAGLSKLLPARLRTANILSAGVDPDTLTDTGWYSAGSWAGSLSAYSIGVLHVQRYSADWIVQTFKTAEAVPKTLVRARYSGTTWGAWQNDLTSAKSYTDSRWAASVMGSGTDLNNMKTEGRYLCNADAYATAALHFPQNNAGLLEVYGGSIIYQRYTVYIPGNNRTYERTFYNSAWGAWVEIFTSANAINNASSIKAGTDLDMGGIFRQKGYTQPRFHRQDYNTAVTNSTGQLTLSHYAPFTPTAAFVTMEQSANYFGLPWGSSAFTATTCTFRWINASTANSLNALNTGSFTVLYIE